MLPSLRSQTEMRLCSLAEHYITLQFGCAFFFTSAILEAFLGVSVIRRLYCMTNLYFAVMYIILGIVRDCTHYWSQVLMLRVRYPPRYSCTQAGGEGRSRWPPTISPTVADVLKVNVCMLILSKPVKKMCQNYTDDLRIEPSCSSTCYPVFSFLFLWHRRMTCDGAEGIIIMPLFFILVAWLFVLRCSTSKSPELNQSTVEIKYIHSASLRTDKFTLFTKHDSVIKFVL